MNIFTTDLSFEWDHGNIDKNYQKHKITPDVAEEAFCDQNLLTFPDPTHSQNENRFHLIGQDKSGDTLFISYTIRHKKIRIISVRIADKKERQIYDQQKA